MMNSIFESTLIPLLEKGAAFSEKRQEVLMGNVANIDTPNYKRRDLPVEDFQKALQKAIERRHQSRIQPKSNSIHSAPVSLNPILTQATQTIDDLFSPELFKAVEATQNNLTFQDGSNRSIESEMMDMTRNTMMQSQLIELMISQMNILETAITERV
jgi:flagellar basal-body rod protein FlgB